ncbi:Glycosyltransferase involved in cell wall bisynthesis [Salinimicrobium sediminis]|uniref:Glycosyltransferase involved in cell wall bisynthesis n=1 Tax=Salinimicrobium sediminis TaxID=1343891 RepID=A0A285WZK3_9FLAO|nr:glycosyltransferase family 4 protein [Salinimicrobium sediminis]SOC78560.1 Glycosyltransferase involved in cell wall bisynthesis [Salinimicrobium sediminis]
MERRIKILFTIPNFDTAGSGKVVYDLVKGLDKNRFEICIACEHNGGDFFKEVEKLNVPNIIMNTNVDYRPYITLIKRLQPVIAFFKENHFDLIHSWHWSSDWTEALAAKLAGVKWIYTKKAMSWGNRHWKIRSFMANYIITINHEMRDYFAYKKSQQLIPIGIDTGYYNPGIFRSTKKEENQTFKIVTVANLVPVKGIEILIKAVHLLDDKMVRLTIVGNDRDPYSEKLRQLTGQLDLEQQVEFKGKQKDVRPFITEADVYVIPTLDEGRKEGMPMALVEAMSMGIPVLGSAISGINFVLKDFPELMFEASNEKELAKKLRELKGSGEIYRKELGHTLRNYTVEHFSMDQFIQDHEKLYVKLCS